MLAARDAADPVCFGEGVPAVYEVWRCKVSRRFSSTQDLPGGAVLERWAFRNIPSPVCSHAPCYFNPVSKCLHPLFRRHFVVAPLGRRFRIGPNPAQERLCISAPIIIRSIGFILTQAVLKHRNPAGSVTPS